MTSLRRRAASEAVGTALLLAVVIGSGIMGERLAGGDEAIALLANSLATGAGLVALVLALGRVSAHFNPLVTLAEAEARRLPWREVPVLVLAQGSGGIGGVLLAHVMFGLPAFSASTHERAGLGQWTGEVVATFGLLLVIQGCRAAPLGETAVAVGAYIAAAYWFTSSTSFANPVVTLARCLTDTFAGIRPLHVPAFVLSQIAGAVLAVVAGRRLFAEARA